MQYPMLSIASLPQICTPTACPRMLNCNDNLPNMLCPDPLCRVTADLRKALAVCPSLIAPELSVIPCSLLGSATSLVLHVCLLKSSESLNW